MQENWSVPLPGVIGSAESDLYMWANVREKPETERSYKYEKCECLCVAYAWLFVSWLEMKLGHSLQLSRAEDELATKVG